MRSIKLDRRWWVAIGVAVIAIAALILPQTVFKENREACRPVRELLDFNSSEGARIQAHSEDELPLGAYQHWADGLAKRAQHVGDPVLAGQSIRLADLASQFVAKLPQVPSNPAHGTEPPPVVYEMSALNDQITDQIRQLDNACPA